MKKLLIANRGEIALRVNRAAHELGIRTVAIFSEADRQGLVVSAADEAFCVGPGPAARSYLNVPNIISAALISGADAVHPGYGFLAENARFAEICGDHGLTFVGPTPAVIAQMGDKSTARRLMEKAGIPTTPGSDVLPSSEAARAAARRMGYPVMLKAAAGGGGKGMREVRSDAELEHAFATAQAEAEANFKDGRLYLEKLIQRPRHVEVQILGDTHGTILHLGERDCSVQKPSHQKLIEEAPAPLLSDRVRKRLHATALAAARAVGYTSAGTIEFLVDGEDIYFMEMNTRIQVEHPVTEMLYGVDLVAEQLRIASGERLTMRQRDLIPRGHVIECRINAEEYGSFAPAAGTLSEVVLPGGPGVRVDSAIFAGLTIPPYYDSLLAKIIAFGTTREAALARMDRALAETRIVGVSTTVGVCREVVQNAAFARGGVTVDFLPTLNAEATHSAGYSRRHYRELALQTLFRVEIGHQDPSAALDDALTGSPSPEGRAFVEDLVQGTLEHAVQSDDLIQPLLEGWTIERLPTVDRLLLRMAVYELRHRPETPRPVVINEAVELAKKFSTEDSGRFVNGVLSHASRLVA